MSKLIKLHPPRYSIYFNFDCKGEPPEQIIADQDGAWLITIHEEPTCTLGGALVEIESGVFGWSDPWSWEQEDWEPSALAAMTLEWMNSEKTNT